MGRRGRRGRANPRPAKDLVVVNRSRSIAFGWCKLSGKHVLHLGAPYLDRGGRRAGVVFVSLGLDWLALRLDSAQWNGDQAFSIVDPDGTILVRQPEYARFVGRPFPADLWALARAATAPG